jgi:hypothetical protein
VIEMLLAHGIGDWLLQSQYMASGKVKSSVPALAHVTVYGVVFALLVTRSPAALAVIVGTHYFIDRYRLARHVNWLANFLAPIRRPVKFEYTRSWTDRMDHWHSTNPPWSECKTYGSPPRVPDHVAFMVMIVVDQVMHLTINYATLRWLA